MNAASTGPLVMIYKTQTHKPNKIQSNKQMRPYLSLDLGDAADRVRVLTKVSVLSEGLVVVGNALVHALRSGHDIATRLVAALIVVVARRHRVRLAASAVVETTGHQAVMLEVIPAQAHMRPRANPARI